MTVTQFGLLAIERIVVDLAFDPQIQSSVLLGGDQGLLPLEFRTLSTGNCLDVLGFGGEHGPEPVPDAIVFDPDFVKEGQNLPIQFGFRNSCSRMAGLIVFVVAFL